MKERTIQQHLDEHKEIRSRQSVAQKLLAFQGEWGAKISEITKQQFGLVFIPSEDWGGELWLMNLVGEPFTVERFDYEPAIDEIFTAIYGPCNCPPDRTCRTCEAVAEAVYGDEVNEPYTIVGVEFEHDEEMVLAAVERYVS